MLSVRGLETGYGRVKVLQGVSIDVRPAEIVTLVGSNGAGKSTLLKGIAGLLPAWSGTVAFDGRDVTGVPAHARVRRGLVLVPEGRMLFMSMTVDENLKVGAYTRRGRGARQESAEQRELVFDLFPVLRDRVRQAAGTLSGGEQQMLAVGRALMSRPKALLLDEPSLGLAPKVVVEIFTALEALRAAGITILLVEQDATLALRHADRGYVMRTGEVVLSGPSAELLADDHVRHIYLGAWDQARAGSADGSNRSVEMP
jgi:branched-chain amino acid transport system ATP-binding protein